MPVLLIIGVAVLIASCSGSTDTEGFDAQAFYFDNYPRLSEWTVNARIYPEHCNRVFEAPRYGVQLFCEDATGFLVQGTLRNESGQIALDGFYVDELTSFTIVALHGDGVPVLYDHYRAAFAKQAIGSTMFREQDTNLDYYGRYGTVERINSRTNMTIYHHLFLYENGPDELLVYSETSPYRRVHPRTIHLYNSSDVQRKFVATMQNETGKTFFENVASFQPTDSFQEAPHETEMACPWALGCRSDAECGPSGTCSDEDACIRECEFS